MSTGMFALQRPGAFSFLVFALSIFSVSGGTLTLLASFAGTNGSSPHARLLLSTNGDFYGTTQAGGPGVSRGTVFSVSTNGVLNTLLSFNPPPYTLGADPQAGLVQGQDGAYYGTTSSGGVSFQGTIFRVAADGTATLSYAFTGGYDGGEPEGALLEGTNGEFYGTTWGGGFYYGGTAFEMTSGGAVNPLYSFSGSDGLNPCGSLLQGRDGNFYGVTRYGGNGYDQTDFSGLGSVFSLTPDGTLTPLVLFVGSDGAHPAGGLLQARDGNFYGTTYDGGGSGGSNGTVFRITAAGAFTSLVSFNGTNGAHPSGELLEGWDGALYGTTSEGGLGYDGSPGSGFGAVFKVTTNGELTTMLRFNGVNGALPLAGLTFGYDGLFYGTTAAGGLWNQGAVFRLSLQSPPAPTLEIANPAPGSVSLTWAAQPGQMYQVQYTTNLYQHAWTDLAAPIATSAVLSFSDSGESDSGRFYRVLIPAN